MVKIASNYIVEDNMIDMEIKIMTRDVIECSVQSCKVEHGTKQESDAVYNSIAQLSINKIR